MSGVLLIGLLLGFLVGVGSLLAWAVCSNAAADNQAHANRQLSAEVQAALHRLDLRADLVQALMFDIRRGHR